MPIDPTAASANRMAGKTASDALKKGNNAGMLFKKEMKQATTIHDVRTAQQRLRMKETDTLRRFS
jgi:hypothetical protein